MPYVPPGYTGVKVFTNPKSKVYAYGYDKKGRKQIIYNKWFIDEQKEKRFKHILGLKTSMKTLKQNVNEILSASKVDVSAKDVQICVVLRLIFICNFRIGNAKYAKDNGSYGLTTLEWQHIKFKKQSVSIEFIGKKGVLNQGICDDAAVFKILKKMYKTRDPTKSCVFSVSSKDVNDYIRGVNPLMTAKDIRTWHANYLYVQYFNQFIKEGMPDNKAMTAAVNQVALALHNTAAVCKKNYLLPEFTKKDNRE
jgi:DNA topoisomerase-1